MQEVSESIDTKNTQGNAYLTSYNSSTLKENAIVRDISNIIKAKAKAVTCTKRSKISPAPNLNVSQNIKSSQEVGDKAHSWNDRQQKEEETKTVKAENKKLKDSNSNQDRRLRELEASIQLMQSTISELSSQRSI